MKQIAKTLLTCLAVLCVISTFAQLRITKYYDAYWKETPEKDAAFYAFFVKNGAHYDCTSYWMSTKNVRGISVQKDTVMGFGIGLMKLYDKEGRLEDSTYFQDSVMKFQYHFYPNGRLHASYVNEGSAQKSIVKGYDEDGNSIKNFIFQREAEFKSGISGWQKYLMKKAILPKDILERFSKSKPKENSASVIVRFIIDEEGYVMKPEIMQSSGYPYIDRYAIGAISDSPQWNPAIQYNKLVKAIRIQPIKYQLQ